MAKIGVLLVNLGTPDEPTRGAVYRYLKEFLLDPRVIDYAWLPRNLLVRGLIAPFRSGKSAKLYQELWTENGSPIKHYGYLLRDLVATELGDGFEVRLAMRYQSPSIESELMNLLRRDLSKIIVFPLFPQYASATTGSIHDEVMRILRGQAVIPPISFINSYYDHPDMVDVFVKNAKKYDLKSYDHILFSYHGLPQRQLIKGDLSESHCLKKENCCATICADNKYCYSAQCHATSIAIADKLGLQASDYTVCFQSRLGPEAWAQPYTIKVIENWRKEKNAKRLLVFSPAFVADCLETIIEIGDEYQEEFEAWGGEKIDLVESLNDNPNWAKAVAEMVRAEIPQTSSVSHGYKEKV